MKKTKYTTRFILKAVIEAETPLAVGSGRNSIMTDALVATDVNGLPYIPGTSLAGVLRSACGVDEAMPSAFGYLIKDEGEGSRLIFSDAIMIGAEGRPMDGLQSIDFTNPFYARFKTLPIRQHVRIGDKGTTKRGGKFDEQIVYQGTRFCFSIELLSDGNSGDNELIERLQAELSKITLRLGGGTRHGFGSIKVVNIQSRAFDLTNADDLKEYVSRSASLETTNGTSLETIHNPEWKHYELELYPADFFLFGSGMGDNDADITPAKESFIIWNDGKPSFVEEAVLIPASSVKGALSHRTAYHWNRLEKRFADNNQEADKGLVGDDNQAVVSIFGKSGDGVSGDIKRGNIMLSDILIPVSTPHNASAYKILNHVSIDRFTGGSIDGALFTEKTVNTKAQNLNIRLAIDVRQDAIADGNIKEAFEQSLLDITKGLLPLGGGVNRGNGMFYGKLIKEDA